MKDEIQIHFWAHMLDECFNKHMLTEGKHWPEDYVKTAYNLIKSSKLGQASWYNDEYIKKDLNNIVQDFTPLAHKNSNLGFFMAIIRWFIEYSGDSIQKYQEFLERKLDNIVKTLLKIVNDKSYDAQREQIKMMTFAQFEKLAEKVNAKASTDIIQTSKISTKYNIIPIYSYEELHSKYGGDVTGYEGKSEWCHASGKSTYDTWTKAGTQMFFVIEQEGWKDIDPPDPNTTTCYDAYGMSLIAILVDVASNKLLNSTSRWNHVILPKSGAADTMFETWQQLNKAVGLNVEKICKDSCSKIKDNLKAKIDAVNKKAIKILAKDSKIDKCTIPNDIKLYITNIVIPDSVTSIGTEAFVFCRRLTSVVIPDSVTSIGDYAFFSCSGLKSVTIGNGVTSIGNYAFYRCSGLTSVTIGNGVTSIGEGAFFNCYSLMDVTIPDSVKIIEPDAFQGCNNLKSMTIGNSVTNIGDWALYNCNSLISVVFQGKTLKQVKAMKNYPWGIDDENIIKAKG